VETTNEHGAKRKNFFKEEILSEKKNDLMIWIERLEIVNCDS
jgi:hypothetical protein